MIRRWNHYRASAEGRMAFRALATKQTLHQTTIDAVDQALELAFYAGGVASVEETINQGEANEG